VQRLGGLDALDLSRQIVQALYCPACEAQRDLFQPIDRITAEQAVCAACGGECSPRFVHSIEPHSPLLDRTAGEVGLPAWDIVWARHGATMLGIELAGDRRAWSVVG
jgi:hypothetical protein